MTKVLRTSYIGRRGTVGEIPRQARVRRHAPIRGPTPRHIYARGELEAGPIYARGTSWKLDKERSRNMWLVLDVNNHLIGQFEIEDEARRYCEMWNKRVRCIGVWESDAHVVKAA